MSTTMLSPYDIVNRSLGNEGGYSNNLSDPGGETNWGIAKNSHPHIDIKNLTRDQAITIYVSEYWPQIEKLGLPMPVAFEVYDFTINSNFQTAIRKLQKAIGVADDGDFGPVSLAALRQSPILDVLVLYNCERLDFFRSLSKWNVFGNGWAGRISHNLRLAVSDSHTL